MNDIDKFAMNRIMGRISETVLHAHEDDDKAWDMKMIDWCDDCEKNRQSAIDEGRCCPTHPEAYFDALTKECEECNELAI